GRRNVWVHRRPRRARLQPVERADRRGRLRHLWRSECLHPKPQVWHLRRLRAGLGPVSRAHRRPLASRPEQQSYRRLHRVERGGDPGGLPDRGAEMTDRTEFLARAARSGGAMVPLVREVVLDADTPVAVLAKIARPPFAFLLESVVGGERWARYTFLGTEPREVLRYRGSRERGDGGRLVERWTRDTGWAPAGTTDDPIGHLAARLRALPAAPLSGLPRFTGGAVG